MVESGGGKGNKNDSPNGHRDNRHGNRYGRRELGDCIKRVGFGGDTVAAHKRGNGTAGGRGVIL